MMRLSKLELSGFKSFAKKTELSFDSKITAIVGPNGSGKSNVAESFRFGLGEQSMKSLRGKRGEDLIFNGGAGSSKINRGSVSITLANKDRFFENIDFDEVVIERTVYRDGINEYSINGSKVRLKDIQELLARANVGESGHHIISQGEADRILSANPKERMSMIEEALGLRIYKYKKDEARKKLEKTEENKALVSSLRREIVPHLKFLEKQVEKAERFEEIKKDLIAAYNEFFPKEEFYLKENISKNANDLSKQKDELEEIDKSISHLSSTKVPEKIDETKSREIESRLSELREEARDIAIAIGRLDGMIEMSAKTTEVSVDERELAELLSAVNEIKKESGDTQDSFKLRLFIENISTKVSGFINKYISGEQRFDSKGEELLKEKKELEEKQSKVQSKITELGEKLKAEQKQILEAQSSARESDKKLFDLERQRDALARNVSDGESRKTYLSHRDDELRQEKSDAIRLVGEAAFTAPEYSGESPDEQEMNTLKRGVERMKIRIEEFGGVDNETLKEHKEVKERAEFLAKELEDLNSSAKALENIIRDLDAELQNTFNEGLVKINTAFGEYFRILFSGGAAKLTVLEIPKKREEGEEVQNEFGVDISVQVPGKKVKGLMALSGGERALTSIALIFAMSQVTPPPFLILDETDAALDEANSKRYGDMLEELSKHSQLILITHNRETMSRAGVLYGVTMSGDGASSLLSVKFEDAVQVAK